MFVRVSRQLKKLQPCCPLLAANSKGGLFGQRATLLATAWACIYLQVIAPVSVLSFICRLCSRVNEFPSMCPSSPAAVRLWILQTFCSRSTATRQDRQQVTCSPGTVTIVVAQSSSMCRGSGYGTSGGFADGSGVLTLHHHRHNLKRRQSALLLRRTSPSLSAIWPVNFNFVTKCSFTRDS